ncbi:MAG: VCBS repeat-containing protein [bacterium]|nr:VCBS repeat-containing protein [bacterium]
MNNYLRNLWCGVCLFSLILLSAESQAYDVYNLVAEDVIAVDLNGDTYPDLVATELDSIVVMINDGFGAFPTMSGYYAGGPQAASLVAGQFDGDALLDIAVTNRGNNTIAFLSGNGDGSFNAPVTVPTLPEPYSIVAADFDSQNGPDLAVISADIHTDSIYIHYNDGLGGFASVDKKAVDENPVDLIAADFNNDTHPDLAICHWGTPWIGTGQAAHEVWLLFGNGDGTFQPPDFLDVIMTAHTMTSGDLDGDGHIDLLVGSNDEDTPFSALIGFENDGNGNFSPGGFAEIFLDAWPWKMAIAELDDNGTAEIPVGMWDASTDLRVYVNESNQILDTLILSKPDIGIKGIEIAELNNWGYAEMIVISGGTLAVYINGTHDCCRRIRGNVNYDIDDIIDITDLTIMVNCMFADSSGPCTICIAETDVDGSGSWDVVDLTTLVDYLFQGGGPPAVCLDLF